MFPLPVQGKWKTQDFNPRSFLLSILASRRQEMPQEKAQHTAVPSPRLRIQRFYET